MTVPMKLAGFTLVLLIVFGGAAAVGAAVGPVGVADANHGGMKATDPDSERASKTSAEFTVNVADGQQKSAHTLTREIDEFHRQSRHASN